RRSGAEHCLSARAICATHGPISRRPSVCSATARRSDSKTGCGARSNRSVSEQVKVLRVIARLNVGGPALHVAYLTAGLADRGYDTTLVAGTLARGEESMAHVAEQRGVTIEQLEELHREIAPLRDLKAMLHLARLIRRERP